MIKNIKRFLVESEKKKKEFLKKLSIGQAAKIMGNLISSNLLRELVSRPKETPLAIKQSLKHAKLAR